MTRRLLTIAVLVLVAAPIWCRAPDAGAAPALGKSKGQVVAPEVHECSVGFCVEVIPGVWAPKSQRSAVLAYLHAVAVDERLVPALDWYDWDRLADCESSGDWGIESGNPFSGGIQILPDTWRRNGGLEFAERPSQATRAEQIVVGRAIADAAGWSQWPGCAARLRLT